MEVSNLRIIAKGGREFQGVEECLSYEEKLKAEKIAEQERQKKLEADREKRFSEIQELRTKLNSMEDNYSKDYGYTIFEDPLTLFFKNVGRIR